MRTFPEIEAEIHYQKVQRLNRARPRAGPAPAAPRPGVWIEGLVLPGERPEELRRQIDAAYAAYTPELPAEAALVDQAIVAQIEIQRCQRSRAVLRAGKARTAEIRWREACEDETRHYVRMFNTDPDMALAGLKRSAGGVRYLIRRWTDISNGLSTEGTVYGADRVEMIQMQGHSAIIDYLYLSEPAWETFRDCLATQPNPKQRDIEMICAPDVVPKSLQDRDLTLWPVDPEASRARLRAIVDRELPPLVALEAELRTRYEEPERAAAVERALAQVDKDEQQLLRELRSHERSLAQAHKALANRGGRGFNTNTGTCELCDGAPSLNHEVLV
jgi:hypothetical protein